MENTEKNTKKDAVGNGERSWMKDLNLKPEDFSQCPEDQNPLLWAFESKLLEEDTYTHWASEAYDLPILKTEFFELGWDKTLRAAFQDVFPWEKDCFPVYKWQDVLYVACLEPQQIPVDAKVCFLIASPSAMMRAWEDLENLQQPPLSAVDGSPEERPPLPAPEDDLGVTPHTSEIVAAHPDLEPSILDFDLTSLDISSVETSPEGLSEGLEPTPRFPDNKTEEVTQIADPRIPDDITQEHTALIIPAEIPEPPNLESLEGLDFGALDLGGPPPPAMEDSEDEGKNSGKTPNKENDPEIEVSAAAALPLSPPSFADLDLSALAPGKESTPEPIKAKAPHPSPESLSEDQPLDFDFSLPDAKTPPAPAAQGQAPPTPVNSAPPVPLEASPPEPIHQPPSPKVEAKKVLKSPPPAPHIKASAPPVPALDLAPPAAPPMAQAPLAPAPPAFDDDKTPPPKVIPLTPSASSAPSDKSITLEHLKGGPDLEKCESLPQIVEHIFSKVHKDFNKLMWIPKSRTKGFIPDLVMGPWSPKDDTWTTSVNIRNANIFRVAWSSKLPFHGPVSLNTTNTKYFEMWDKGEVPEHVTIFPLCTESKKCLGFVVGCGKGPEFDSKKTLKRFGHVMDLTAKQLSATSLDKAA